MIKALVTAASLVVVAAGIAGCVSDIRHPIVQCKFPSQAPPAPGAALVAQEYGQITPIPLDAVQFTDNLVNRVAVQLLRADRTPTNTIQVTARIVNCTDATLVVGIRTHFMDANQAPTEAESIWQNVPIEPRSMGSYQEKSISKAVEHYVVELRNAGP